MEQAGKGDTDGCLAATRRAPEEIAPAKRNASIGVVGLGGRVEVIFLHL